MNPLANVQPVTIFKLSNNPTGPFAMQFFKRSPREDQKISEYVLAWRLKGRKVTQKRERRPCCLKTGQMTTGYKSPVTRVANILLLSVQLGGKLPNGEL